MRMFSITWMAQVKILWIRLKTRKSKLKQWYYWIGSVRWWRVWLLNIVEAVEVQNDMAVKPRKRHNHLSISNHAKVGEGLQWRLQSQNPLLKWEKNFSGNKDNCRVAASEQEVVYMAVKPRKRHTHMLIEVKLGHRSLSTMTKQPVGPCWTTMVTILWVDFE